MKDFIGGFTALHYAAMHGRARIARLMLESDFRRDIINAKSNDGWTPLHVAAHYGRDSFVRLLLEFRAEVDPLSDKGTTPLQLAIIRERSSCVRILLDHSANIDIQNGFLLRYAVIKGNHSYCRMFLQRGADTNLGRLEDGQTPLHLSALRDDALCAQMLYAYGADTNTRNYEGQTPVALSVSMSGISRPCLDFLQEVTSKSASFSRHCTVASVINVQRIRLNLSSFISYNSVLLGSASSLLHEPGGTSRTTFKPLSPAPFRLCSGPGGCCRVVSSTLS